MPIYLSAVQIHWLPYFPSWNDTNANPLKSVVKFILRMTSKSKCSKAKRKTKLLFNIGWVIFCNPTTIYGTDRSSIDVFVISYILIGVYVTTCNLGPSHPPSPCPNTFNATLPGFYHYVSPSCWMSVFYWKKLKLNCLFSCSPHY